MWALGDRVDMESLGYKFKLSLPSIPIAHEMLLAIAIYWTDIKPICKHHNHAQVVRCFRRKAHESQKKLPKIESNPKKILAWIFSSKLYENVTLESDHG